MSKLKPLNRPVVLEDLLTPEELKHCKYDFEAYNSAGIALEALVADWFIHRSPLARRERKRRRDRQRLEKIFVKQ